MAELRTQMATVTRLAGSKGVVVKETVTAGEREFSLYFTAWVGEGHGLNVGDSARFVGDFSWKKTERNGRTYVDLNLNRASMMDGTLERADDQPEPSWTGDGGWDR